MAKLMCLYKRGMLYSLVIAALFSASVSADEPVMSFPSHVDLSVGTRQSVLSPLNGQPVPRYADMLEKLYADRNGQPMWQNEAAVRSMTQQVAELAVAGIDPQFGRWMRQLSSPALQGMSRDIVLSDAMLGYLAYLSGLPNQGEHWLYGTGQFALPALPEKQIAQWVRAVDQGQSATFVAGLIPEHIYYQGLHQTLVKLLAEPASWPVLKENRTLRPGDRSSDVPALRSILSLSGLLPAESTADDSGVYSADLVNGVRQFQRQEGLEPDGVVGGQTRSGLNMSPHQRAAIVALNIQRLRLLPDDMNTGIMVNIPAYSLRYYVGGNEALQSRVIVGRPDRKTPLMLSELHNVVINPPWNVPDSLARKDILPKVRQDPSYLERRGYTMYRGWGQGAEPVDPMLVDWSLITDRNLPFRFQQRPGDLNALGHYKFNIPNNDAIYLHDTPNHNLFRREQRALSSGCVRVNKAAELADMLLQDNGWNLARITAAREAGTTRYIGIKQKIPVRLYYLTAFSEPGGQTAFRADIYHYDRLARAGVSQVNEARMLLQ